MKTICIPILASLVAVISTLGISTSFGDSPQTHATTLEQIITGVPGVDLEALKTAPDGDLVKLPAPLQQIVDEHVRDWEEAPSWVRELSTKKIEEYFPPGSENQIKLRMQGIQQLQTDAKRLHEYYEKNDKSELYANFIERKLVPFIKQIDPKKLASAIRNHAVTTPIGKWTVENLVVKEQLAYLGRLPNFVKNAMSLLTGRHLRGASSLAGMIVLGAVGTYTYHELVLKYGFETVVEAGGAIYFAIKAGPLTAVMNSLTGWFVQPTTEFVRLLASRYMGPYEQKVNHFYDRLKPRSLKTADASRNETPNIPSRETDNMDFAGMSPEEQALNWDKNLRMWVAVAKTFGQLLRDTHHSGRVLMMISWSDEQLTTTLVETMDSKMILLSVQAEGLLTPYKTAILADSALNAQNRSWALADLEADFDLYQNLSETKWMVLDQDEIALQELDKQIDEAYNGLVKAGMTNRDLAKLKEIQTRRAEALTTLITALALNEIRSFNVAEANRNLEDEARQAQRAIRGGFHLQVYVDKYREHVRQMMEKMGYTNKKKISCNALFGH